METLAEHASIIISLLAFLLLAVFTALVGLLVWVGKGIVAEVKQLRHDMNALFERLRAESRTEIGTIQSDLQQALHRITKLETRCDTFHAGGAGRMPLTE